MNSLNVSTQPVFKIDSLCCIRADTQKEAADVNAVVDMLINPAGVTIGNNNNYWENLSSILLAGMITHVLHDPEIAAPQKTITTVVRLLSPVPEGFFVTLEASPHAAVARAARLMQDVGQKVQQALLGIIRSGVMVQYN